MPGIKAFVVLYSVESVRFRELWSAASFWESSRSSEKAYISSQVADAIVFAVLIVVLLVKPTGLFGKNIQEKV